MCLRMCVSTHRLLIIISSVIWNDMNPYDWFNKFYSLNMEAVIGIIDRCGL